LLNREPEQRSARASRTMHGPSDLRRWAGARDNAGDGDRHGAVAARRAGRPPRCRLHRGRDGKALPAIFGIGDSLIYFVDGYEQGKDLASRYAPLGFVRAGRRPSSCPTRAFSLVDHLTNNVFKGTMSTPGPDFYKERLRVHRGALLRHPRREDGPDLVRAALALTGRFCIPDQRGGPRRSRRSTSTSRSTRARAIQHLAFATQGHPRLDRRDLSKGTPRCSFLDIDDELLRRACSSACPNVREDHARDREAHNVLVDGDERGLPAADLHEEPHRARSSSSSSSARTTYSFGEGNFGALFRSIERDQMRRGYLT
jgi:4-hydroxyphenylpyruvate dioxygenase